MRTSQAILSLTSAIGLATISLAGPNGGPGDEEPSQPLLSSIDSEPEFVAGGMSEESYLRTKYNTFSVGEGKTVTWGGRIMLDSGWFSGDSSYPTDTASGLEDGVEFRRARFFAKVKINDKLSAKAQYDFAGAGVTFADVYFNFKTDIGSVLAGHFKQPFSLEELTSSRFITFMERAMPVEAFAPARDTGISLSNNLGDDTSYSVGIFRLTDGAGEDTGDGDYGVTARIAHAIPSGDDSVIHLGLAGSVWGSQDIRIRTRPESHILGRVFDTTTMASDGSTLLGAEFAWTGGPTSVQAEYMMNSVDELGGPGSADVDFSGFYAYVSHFLTGESRPYKHNKFDRVHPNEDWNGGFGGAWEVALRYSMVDFDDGPFTTEVSNITAGANWYMNANTRIMFNLVNSDADSGATSDDFTAFMMRLQIDW